MKYVYRALIGPLGVAALVLASNPAFARSGAAHGGTFASPRTAFHSQPFHSQASRSFRNHRRNNAAIFWPADGYFTYDSTGELPPEVSPPISGDVNTKFTYDVPWDWAHRYPPATVPSNRPYISSCPEETLTFPGRDGKDQSVNVMRCY